MAKVKEQEFRCAISGRELTPETASLDHIVPLARGGEHSLANVWIVDHQVNIAKSTMTLDEFVSLCRQVTEHQATLHRGKPVPAEPPAEASSMVP